MGIKTLEKVLNTKAIIQRYENDPNIYIGSPYIYDIITIYPIADGWDVYKVKYNRNFDYDPKETKDGCSAVYTKLLKLVEDHELDRILNTIDEQFSYLFSNKEKLVKVYTFNNGKIITRYAEVDKVGYPNTTIDGYLIYENTYFTDKKKARIKNRLEELIGLKWCSEGIDRNTKQLIKTLVLTIKQLIYVIRSYLN